jgi:CD36 family
VEFLVTASHHRPMFLLQSRRTRKTCAIAQVARHAHLTVFSTFLCANTVKSLTNHPSNHRDFQVFVSSLIDSPVLISFPHFYMADDSLRTAVEGVSPPEKDKHQFFIDVQPVI